MPEPPPTPKKEEDDAELSAQDKIVAAGVGAVETYAKMLEDYQRETTLNMMTLGSYGLIKGGYGFYSSAYANMKRDGIVLGALNTLNPLYHLAVLGADIKIAADNGDWKGVGGAVAKAGAAVVAMVVGAKAGPKGAGGAAAGGGALRGLLARVKIHRHHIFPQKFRAFFEAQGIEIDQFTVEISQGRHLRTAHGRGDAMTPGRFNQRWAEFIEENPNATAKEIYQFGGKLMDEYGLSDMPLVPYR